MIRPGDRDTAARLEKELMNFCRTDTELSGICSPERRATLVAQIIESVRRIKYVERLGSRPVDVKSTDPHDAAFNPIKAAIHHRVTGNRDEAFWLVFLLTHFGKHTHEGWSLLRAIYGRLGEAPIWSWAEFSSNVNDFRDWLAENKHRLEGLKFGNHRKYESLRMDRRGGLFEVLCSYADWVGDTHSHDQKIHDVVAGINDPRVVFDNLYRDTSEILRWGRLAKFDHLTMLDKIGLIDMKPGKAYLAEATGPRAGAALLLYDDANRKLDIVETETVLVRLGDSLGVGQQVIEDSLCNWQKSPDLFVPFR